jgi:hypothetical protein
MSEQFRITVIQVPGSQYRKILRWSQ